MFPSLKPWLIAALVGASLPVFARHGTAELLMLEGINGESEPSCAVPDCNLLDLDGLSFTIGQPDGEAVFSPLTFSAQVSDTGLAFLRTLQDGLQTGAWEVRATLRSSTAGGANDDIWVDGRIITADNDYVVTRRLSFTIGDVYATGIHWRLRNDDGSPGELVTGGWGLGGNPAFSGDPRAIDGLFALGAHRLANGDILISQVPEPGHWALWLVGALGLGLAMRRARSDATGAR
jgi:hypothetical protein